MTRYDRRTPSMMMVYTAYLFRSFRDCKIQHALHQVFHDQREGDIMYDYIDKGPRLSSAAGQRAKHPSDPSRAHTVKMGDPIMENRNSFQSVQKVSGPKPLGVFFTWTYELYMYTK